jgi:phospholipase/lecithinase/hemolysin
MFALHRLFSCITLGCAALLSACGSGSTFEPLVPSRVISFGDGLSDVGNSAGGGKFTVNDGTVNIWVERVATSYGKTITASVNPGGLGFAQGGSRVNTGTYSIADQITAFLPGNIGANDLIIVDAGVAELAALAAANPSDSALTTAADAAGRALGVQVLRLTAAGGKHVVVANAPDLGKSPFAQAQTRTAAISAATRAFNDGLKLSLANVTSGVLFIDNEAYINTLIASPTLLGSGGNATTVSTAACATSTFSTNTCTTSTLATNVTAATYALHLYSDDRHLAPAAHRLLGDNAYNKIKNRW